jgi:predicted GNAT family acetyltransferase
LLDDYPSFNPTRLDGKHIEQMIALAALTKPGPFGPRTIEFGHYYGVFENSQLVAMTGQRLHVQSFSEISAVCTHPDHLGKGYATALVQHQVNLILRQHQVPFLHVRADNQRAIAVYERLGFKKQGSMNFYFMKK